MSCATSAPVQSLEPADVGPRVNLGRSTRDRRQQCREKERGKVMWLTYREESMSQFLPPQLNETFGTWAQGKE